MGELTTDTPTIQLGVFVATDQRAIDALGQTLNQWAPQAGSGLHYLGAVWLVPDGELSAVANAIIQASAAHPGTYQQGDYKNSAVALPVETNSGLVCHIVLEENVALGLLRDPTAAGQAVSSVLEELLHVRVYGTRWEQTRRIQSSRESGACDSHIKGIASTMHDEYIVGRLKAGYLAEHTGLRLHYGKNLAQGLDRAGENMQALTTRWEAEDLDIQEVWESLLTLTYRNVFEHLSRDAGFRDGNADVDGGDSRSQIDADASRSIMYRHIVQPYWDGAYDQLQRSFSTNLVEMENSIAEITVTLKNFLQAMGLTYSEQEESRCYIHFDSTEYHQRMS